jgi:transcriptional regulator with XRE-family HTH domain
MYSFLENLDNELKLRHLNHSWIAKKINVGTSTISTWFNENRPPRLDLAHKIAEALNISLDYLITGKEFEIKKVYKDSITNELCEYLDSLEHDELVEARTVLKYIRYMKLIPEPKQKKRPSSGTSNQEATLS